MAERQLIVKIIGDSHSLQRAFTQSSRGAKDFDRNISRASRGAISAAVSFRGLGRALAFGSTSFLGGAGIVFALKSTIQAAEESQRVLGQTANAVQRSGLSWTKYGKQIQEAALAQSNLSGFDDERLLGTFSNLVRRTGDVTQALKLNALAADVARGRNISLEAAQQLVLKASIGNVGALRRLGINIGKNASAYAALDLIQRKYTGSAARYGNTAAGAQDKFANAVQNTQELLGSAAIPVITKYLNIGAAWLSQSKNQERIQHDVTTAVKDVSAAVTEGATVVRGITGAFGGLKNTLEILVAVKISRVALGWISAFQTTGGAAAIANGKVGTLRGSLLGLNALSIAPIVIPIELAITKKEKDWVTKHFGRGGAVIFDAIKVVTAPGTVAPQEIWKDIRGGGSPRKNTSGMSNDPLHDAADRIRKGLDLTGPIGDLSGITRAQKKALTATQRNQFFDNAIARILQRGGLGTIQQQTAALIKANQLIEARLKATKDVTRRLTLEDELMQNAAQLRSLNEQAAADALAKRQEAFSEFIANLQLGVTKAQATAGFGNDIVALKALQGGIKLEIREFGRTADLAGQLFDVQQQIKAARTQQIAASEFFTLGLGPTGDTRVPFKAALKRQLGSLTESLKGTALDTPKLETQLANFRKVLTKKIVPTEVRAKIKELLDGIADDLKNHSVNLNKWVKTNPMDLLAGLDIDAATKKALRARLSVVGVGGTVPHQTAVAGGFGGQTIVVQHTTKLDGAAVERSTTRHQQKRARRNPQQKRGPH